MGGAAAGEVASAVAIASLAPLDHDTPGSDLLAELRGAASSANGHLRDMVASDDSLRGMGTTLVALLFAGTRLGMLHIGDSRCYLLRDGELTQITHDHTLVQSLVDEGRITEADASVHPQRSVITRVLDGRDDVDFDLSVREARVGDRYLVCSDGLTGPVGSLDTLREALGIEDPQESVDRLVQLALRGGGPDNVTVIVADVIDEEPDATQPVIAGAAAESPQPAPPGIADTAAGRARVAEGRDMPERVRDRPAPAPSKARRRTLIGLAVLVVLLAVGTTIGYSYVRSQYFVGLEGGNVAVFRGVHGSVAGISLNSLENRTVLNADRLSEVERDRLEDGIVARDERDAQAIVERLFVTSGCASASPPPSPAPSASPTPAATRTAAPIPPTTVPCT
jgi:protein phosphatase